MVEAERISLNEVAKEWCLCNVTELMPVTAGCPTHLFPLLALITAGYSVEEIVSVPFLMDMDTALLLE